MAVVVAGGRGGYVSRYGGSCKVGSMVCGSKSVEYGAVCEKA